MYAGVRPKNFTWEVTSNIPNKGTSPYPAMPEIIVSLKGVEKLLTNINPHKASEPDAIPARVSRNLLWWWHQY